MYNSDHYWMDRYHQVSKELELYKSNNSVQSDIVLMEKTKEANRIRKWFTVHALIWAAILCMTFASVVAGSDILTKGLFHSLVGIVVTIPGATASVLYPIIIGVREWIWEVR